MGKNMDEVTFAEGVVARYQGKNYILAAGALILDKRDPTKAVIFSKHSKPGYSIPGGKAEILVTENSNFRPETPLEAAKREVAEETGLTNLEWTTDSPYIAPINNHLMYTYLAYVDSSALTLESLAQFANTEEGRSYLVSFRLLKCGPYASYNQAMLEHFLHE